MEVEQEPPASPNKKQKTGAECLRQMLVDEYASRKGNDLVFKDAFKFLDFTEEERFSQEMKVLTNELVPIGTSRPETETMTGRMKVYRIPNPQDHEIGEDEILELSCRDSRLYVERDCYSSLFDKIMKIWEHQAKKKIIVTGNSGVGKSWFQVYMLRRLLMEYAETTGNAGGKPPKFRFVMRQVGASFRLLDLKECTSWRVTNLTGGGDPSESSVKHLMVHITNTMYLFEPGATTNLPPSIFSTPSVATLSPNPCRVKDYRKTARPWSLHMPVWAWEDLLQVAQLEGMDLAKLKENYYYFGGVVRRTLELDHIVTKGDMRDLEAKIQKVTPSVLRSIQSGVDDGPNSEERGNISGYIACYTDIPEVGDDAFQNFQLTVTSEGARKWVDTKLQFKDPKDHGQALLKCFGDDSLHATQQDITGIDLEVSSAHMVAAGDRKVAWKYIPAGNADGNSWVYPKYTKREVVRPENLETTTVFDEALLYYPKKRNFGLVDFFLFIGEECWAFQTTWQASHAFKLHTLWELRQNIKVGHDAKLNIMFVVPDKHGETYKKRSKKNYLSAGEDPTKPLNKPQFKKNATTEQLLDADQVKKMWDNTNINVAFPVKSWNNAINDWLVKVDPREPDSASRNGTGNSEFVCIVHQSNASLSLSD